MFQKMLVLSFLITAATLSSGCAIFLLGAGAAGGYSISKDEIEGLSDQNYDKIWTALKETVREQGAPTLEDKERGHLEAVVGKSTVEANIEQVTPKTVRIRIKSRKTKGLFPDIKTAQNLYNQVIRKID